MKRSFLPVVIAAAALLFSVHSAPAQGPQGFPGEGARGPGKRGRSQRGEARPPEPGLQLSSGLQTGSLQPSTPLTGRLGDDAWRALFRKLTPQR